MKRYLLLGLLVILILPLVVAIDNPVFKNSTSIYFNMNNDNLSGSTIFNLGNYPTNGTLVGSPVTGVSGIEGEAIKLRKNAQYATINAIEGSSKNMTWSAWFFNLSTNSVFFGDDTTRGYLGLTDGTTIAIGNKAGSAQVNVGAPINLNALRWQHIAITHSGSIFKVYINGSLKGSAAQVDYTEVIRVGFGENLGYSGRLDEVAIFNKSLNASEITELFEFYIIPQSVVQANITSPANNQGFNSQNISDLAGNIFINFTVSNKTNIDCNFNDSRWSAVDDSGPTRSFLNNTALPDSIYNVNIECGNSTSINSSDTANFTIDIEDPTLVTNFVNDSLFTFNLTGQFNITDNVVIHRITVKRDSVTLFNRSGINTTFFSFNLSEVINNISLGTHNLSIEYADGHTAKKLGGKYASYRGLFNDYLLYNFWDKGSIRTYAEDHSIFDEWESIEESDKYKQVYKPANPHHTKYFIEESDEPIYIISKPGHYGGYWIITGNHWKDYVLEDEPNSKVHIKRLSDNSVRVKITGINNRPEELRFASVGDLNVVTNQFTFFNYNLTTEFESPILSRFTSSYNLTANFGNLTFNITGIIPAAILELNGINLSATLVSFNSQNATFTVLSNNPNISNILNISHRWFFNLSNLTSAVTEFDNQTLILVDLGTCANNNTYPIINFSYFNEISNDPIAITHAYQFKIFDGTLFYNQTASFPVRKNNSLCTNVPPSELTYNWDLWGPSTLSKSGFITRIFDIDPTVPILISNNPSTNLSLFLIETLNSSTINYNWFSDQMQRLDGTMRIFKCNNDGTKSLVESTPIIAGVATANIQLLSTPYSYDVIIGGRIFEDLNSFTRCHIESLTESLVERTFFVTITDISFDEIIAINSIECTLIKTSNNTVKMTWGPNPLDNSFVSGCIVAYRKSILGNTKVFDNCSIESEGFSRQVEVPINGNTYVVNGRLESGNITSICDDEVIFAVEDQAGSVFGITSLLGAIFLILGLVLIYAGQGELQLWGGVAGILLAYMVGLLNFTILEVTSMISFLIVIAIVGRYSRSPQ